MNRFSARSVANSQEALGREKSPEGAGGGPRFAQDDFVVVKGLDFARITNVDRVAPFLMALASDTDLWTFATSNGGITAGRWDSDHALFPYETVDRLYEAPLRTGPLTSFRVHRSRGQFLWEPLVPVLAADAPVERHLYKSLLGHQLIYEEMHRELGLRWRARWASCDEFGFVRTTTLENLGSGPIRVDVLDGLRNVLPSGVPSRLQQQSSCLVDAYKRAEIDPVTRMGIFSLTSRIVDAPIPAEELRANVVWSTGLPDRTVTLAPSAPDRFRQSEAIHPSTLNTGQRGHYLHVAELEIAAGASARWHVVADVGRSPIDVEALRERIVNREDLGEDIETALAASTRNLEACIAGADALQASADVKGTAHHLSNVLFNSMRGGVFDRNYEIPRADLIDFVLTRNREVLDRHGELLRNLPERLTVAKLRDVAEDSGDADFRRLALEYLPLYFGRRHGDPSRPWNRFSIHVSGEDGDRALRYEGNWRDIFQNWEALCVSYPEFLPHMVAKFVNASTVDGYNPYRLGRDGIDWEVKDPKDPWSHIGYWGDHQVAYLVKFLEALPEHDPEGLSGMLLADTFSYADVPYRIRPYDEILVNPRDSILYDHGHADLIAARVTAKGTDGRLLHADGNVVHVNLVEKLLVPALAKLANFVPDGGIWMNTQRPEWNDANNALAGYGVSVVTLCYLRRYLQGVRDILAHASFHEVPISEVVATFIESLHSTLGEQLSGLAGGRVSESHRRRIMDRLGRAATVYREDVYSRGTGERTGVSKSTILDFLDVSLAHVDHSIGTNVREDGLFHAYNVLDFRPNEDTADVHRLDMMLEGQVAALNSGLITTRQALQILERMYDSPLYREDQRSFMLYPDRKLPSFLEKNVIDDARAEAVPHLRHLVELGNRSLVDRDAQGRLRWSADLSNADDVHAILDRHLQQADLRAGAGTDRSEIVRLFEDTFAHRSFTGRSGAMYGYEGLGCIYWHMVAKLLLAVQEIHRRQVDESGQSAGVQELAAAYYRIRAGLSSGKSATENGAFPTDPYSHTPRHAGAQQPGMTGQVKEEILTRFGELGVRAVDGSLVFRPRLLRRREFLDSSRAFHFLDVQGEQHELLLPAGSLGFTYCQVPVVYVAGGTGPQVRVFRTDGSDSVVEGDRLDRSTSRSIFERRGEIARLEVSIPDDALLAL